MGLKGELRIYPFTDYKEKFEEIDYVLISDRKYAIEGVRYLRNTAILKLSEIGNRTDAEKLKGEDVFIFRKDAPPLPEDTYYVKDLIGLIIADEKGKVLGRLKDVIQNSAQDLYEIETTESGKTFLIPAVDEFILNVDLKEGIVTVHLIEGLYEL